MRRHFTDTYFTLFSDEKPVRVFDILVRVLDIHVRVIYEKLVTFMNVYVLKFLVY